MAFSLEVENMNCDIVQFVTAAVAEGAPVWKVFCLNVTQKEHFRIIILLETRVFLLIPWNMPILQVLIIPILKFQMPNGMRNIPSPVLHSDLFGREL